MRIAMRIALATSAMVLALGAAQAQEKVVKIGTEGAYPPFNNLTSDGKLVGFDIDIAQALCDEMKVKCEFIAQDWDGIIPALQAGKFDAIVASMSITPERKEKVDFSNKYYNTPSALAVPKDSTVKGVAKADLAGKSVGVQSSTTHFNYASKTYTDSTVKPYPTAQEYQPVAGDAGWRLLQAARPALATTPRNLRRRRRHRRAQGRHRTQGQAERRHQGHPRQWQIQGNQRQVLQVRRLRFGILRLIVETAKGGNFPPFLPDQAVSWGRTRHV